MLMHCKKGISRSASSVIAYAMKACNWSLDTALNYVKDKRQCITPNKGFMTQLATYQGVCGAVVCAYGQRTQVYSRRPAIVTVPCSTIYHCWPHRISCASRPTRASSHVNSDNKSTMASVKVGALGWCAHTCLRLQTNMMSS